MTEKLLEPGTLINSKYEISERLGAGAHGTVYRAIQHPVGRSVALKFISKHLFDSGDLVLRRDDEGNAPLGE